MITYPLNNIEYDAEDAELYLCTRKSGVFSLEHFPMENVLNTTVTIGGGVAWIHNNQFAGKVTALKEDAEFNCGVADGTYDRYDVIAIEFNKIANGTSIKVINGVPASNPTIPIITQTDSIYQLYLYAILRKAGEATINSGNVIDLRNNNDYCGLMEDTNTRFVLEINKNKPLRFWAGNAEEYRQLPIKESGVLYISDDEYRVPEAEYALRAGIAEEATTASTAGSASEAEYASLAYQYRANGRNYQFSKLAANFGLYASDYKKTVDNPITIASLSGKNVLIFFPKLNAIFSFGDDVNTESVICTNNYGQQKLFGDAYGLKTFKQYLFLPNKDTATYNVHELAYQWTPETNAFETVGSANVINTPYVILMNNMHI